MTVTAYTWKCTDCYVGGIGPDYENVKYLIQEHHNKTGHKMTEPKKETFTQSVITKEEDKLDAIFRMQKIFADQIGNKYGFNKRYPEDQVKALCTAIIHEAVELQDHTNWKWWKMERVIEDKDAAREELIDIFHFVIHAALVLGMTADDFLNEYKKKMEINKQRQEQGY